MGEIPPLGRNRPHRGQFGGVRGGGLRPPYGPNHSQPGKSSMKALSTPGLVGGPLLLGLLWRPPGMVAVAIVTVVCGAALGAVIWYALRTPFETDDPAQEGL